MNLNRFITSALLFAASAAGFNAAPCTSLIVGKAASADSSVIATYAADSYVRYGFLDFQPAGDHRRGDMRQINNWSTWEPMGEIPEVPHTYSTIGNMNEKGLTIVESTWGGRQELAEPNGIIDYGSAIFIALQRAATAREAIKVIDEIINEHGYAGTGESFTIADADEAWVMELIGKGKDEKGFVWVARRIPDDCISGHANNPRIHQFPLDDPESCLYSPDVIEFARKKGYFKGDDKDFSFSLAYQDYDNYTKLRGCDGRVWSYFNKYADGMERYLPWILEGKGEPLPLFVKPNRKIDATDMKWMMRDHYEGTPLDMTQDAGAGYYDSPYRPRPLTWDYDGKHYTHDRPISTQQTGFSLVAEMNASRPDFLRGLMWFGTDDANTCVYLPVFCSVTKVPRQLSGDNGSLYDLSWDSNFWVNNYVANQAYNRYNDMMPDIRAVQKAFEDSIAVDVAVVCEQAPDFDDPEIRRLITDDLLEIWAEKVTAGYKKLGDFLLVKYLDQSVKKQDENGNFITTPYGKPVNPASSNISKNYYESIVRNNGKQFRVPDFKKNIKK
ncbi:MAG: C69 family dipeptidase [Muribaculaceae bacterium]|nr:C69 family dipeptidase [Muribaculaceae bacterium]